MRKVYPKDIDQRIEQRFVECDAARGNRVTPLLATVGWNALGVYEAVREVLAKYRSETANARQKGRKR